jgi:hypothetical protein
MSLEKYKNVILRKEVLATAAAIICQQNAIVQVSFLREIVWKTATPGRKNNKFRINNTTTLK